ncbi:MAG: D-tyrosyl-tRNA(Tyr) deacylase [Elusimicrobia bacterium]|nr:D-tyrosyl-tRNA(Tyr) deacylase [Elusimicrobiota bacterium]
MRALIQRVSQASVAVREKNIRRSIGPGFVILLGVSKTDTQDSAKTLAQKAAYLRIFPNDEGKFDRSLLDVGGECLVISQFTLYGDASKGRRPDFTQAARPETALPLYRLFIDELKAAGVKRVEEGEFQAHMEVSLTNDGPVTVTVET